MAHLTALPSLAFLDVRGTGISRARSPYSRAASTSLTASSVSAVCRAWDLLLAGASICRWAVLSWHTVLLAKVRPSARRCCAIPVVQYYLIQSIAPRSLC